MELFPDWRGKVVFIMVVVPSRQIVSKYNERRRMIEEQVSRINGKYSTLEWQPIMYRYKQYRFRRTQCAVSICTRCVDHTIARRHESRGQRIHR
ncbi:MAG: trehalose-6-phosphate synthase [Bacteroidota bacterium]